MSKKKKLSAPKKDKKLIKKKVVKSISKKTSSKNPKKSKKTGNKSIKKAVPIKKKQFEKKSLKKQKNKPKSDKKNIITKKNIKVALIKKETKKKPIVNKPKKLVPIKKIIKKSKKVIILKKEPNKKIKEKKLLIKKENIKADKIASENLAKKTQYDTKFNQVLAISNNIPIKPKTEIPLSKIVSISNSITNPVKRIDSYSVKLEKEPNGKFELEFVVHSSPEMLFEFLSTPSGLSEWFCDDLNIRNGIYTFIWDDQMQQARLLKTVDLQLVRFQWVEKIDGSFFEFRIQRDELTNDISLIITDFADTVSERESSKLLWQSQIEKLLHLIGSIF